MNAADGLSIGDRGSIDLDAFDANIVLTDIDTGKEFTGRRGVRLQDISRAFGAGMPLAGSDFTGRGRGIDVHVTACSGCPAGASLLPASHFPESPKYDSGKFWRHRPTRGRVLWCTTAARRKNFEI